MSKNLGIVKKQWESMVGIQVEIITYCSEDKVKIEKWFKKFPTFSGIYRYEKMMIQDVPEEIERFFESFQDFDADLTQEDREAGKKLYKEMMEES